MINHFNHSKISQLDYTQIEKICNQKLIFKYD